MQGLDTHDAYERLKESNFNDRQARGIVNIVKQAVTGELATKANLAELKGELRTEIAELKGELKTEIADLRSELRTEIADLRSELKTEIADLRSELKADITHLDVKIETVQGDLNAKIEIVRTELARQYTRMTLLMIGSIPAVVAAVKFFDYLLGS